MSTQKQQFPLLGRFSSALKIVTLLAFALGSHTAARASNTVRGSSEGDAFGSYGFVGSQQLTAKLGKSAYITCPCTGTEGVVKSNVLTSLSSGTTLATGLIRDTASTTESDTQDIVRMTSRVESLNLLAGVVTADEVLAVATTRADATKVSSGGGGSRFSKLRIGGLIFADNVSANTTVNLPGYGRVVLRETKRRGDGEDRGGVIVNMLHVYVTQSPNPLNLPLNAQIIVGHANSGWVRFESPIYHGGSAWVADSVHAAPALAARLGRIAPIWVRCQGTNGATKTNTIANFDVPGVLSLGNGDTSAFGGMKNGARTTRMTATVLDVDLLNGLVTADSVSAVSESSYDNGQGAFSTNGSGFVNLRVNGQLVAANVAPNTQIDLPELGYVRLYQRFAAANSNEARTNVKMIRLVVTQSNGLGLSVGTEISVAVANSMVKRY